MLIKVTETTGWSRENGYESRTLGYLVGPNLHMVATLYLRYQHNANLNQLAHVSGPQKGKPSLYSVTCAHPNDRSFHTFTFDEVKDPSPALSPPCPCGLPWDHCAGEACLAG